MRLLILSVIVGFSSLTYAHAKGGYSPAVYDGTATAVLPNTNTLDECVALVREKSTSEERAKLRFKKDPFEERMPEIVRQKAAEMREGQLGGCAGDDGYYIVTETGFEKRQGPNIYIEK